MQDLVSRIAATHSLAPAARTASANGTGVDLANTDSAVVVFHTGTITDGTHTTSVDESDDNAAFTAVAAADLIGTAPVINNTKSNTALTVGYVGKKRYIRASVAVAGTTTGGVYGASVLAGKRRKQP